MSQGSNGASPEQLEREIAATRLEIEATLEAIQDKLSPGQLLDQALGYMRRNGAEFAGNVGRSVRDNPLPLALVGVGLSWLMMAGNRPGPGTSVERTPADESGRLHEDVSERTHATRDRAASTGEDIKRKADDVVAEGQERIHRAGETARHFGERAKETYGEARAGAESLAHSAAARAGKAQESAGRFINDHPLVIGAAAVAAGAVLAALVPTTRREGEVMGEEAARAREAVSEGAEETFESAKKVARAVRTGVKKGAAKGTGSPKGMEQAGHADSESAAAESGPR